MKYQFDKENALVLKYGTVLIFKKKLWFHIILKCIMSRSWIVVKCNIINYDHLCMLSLLTESDWCIVSFIVIDVSTYILWIYVLTKLFVFKWPCKRASPISKKHSAKSSCSEKPYLPSLECHIWNKGPTLASLCINWMCNPSH